MLIFVSKEMTMGEHARKSSYFQSLGTNSLKKGTSLRGGLTRWTGMCAVEKVRTAVSSLGETGLCKPVQDGD